MPRWRNVCVAGAAQRHGRSREDQSSSAFGKQFSRRGRGGATEQQSPRHLRGLPQRRMLRIRSCSSLRLLPFVLRNRARRASARSMVSPRSFLQSISTKPACAATAPAPASSGCMIYGYAPIRVVSAPDSLNLIPEFASTATSSHPVTHAAIESAAAAQPAGEYARRKGAGIDARWWARSFSAPIAITATTIASSAALDRTVRTVRSIRTFSSAIISSARRRSRADRSRICFPNPDTQRRLDRSRCARSATISPRSLRTPVSRSTVCTPINTDSVVRFATRRTAWARPLQPSPASEW